MPGQAISHEPSSFFRTATPQNDRVLLILNQPIASTQLLDRLWQSCFLKICADGAANRLSDLLQQGGNDTRTRYLPDLIHGDLDSLDPEIGDWYRSHGVSVTKDADQYSTDFQKVMKWVISHHGQQVKDILVLGSISGRVDQGLGLLSEMIREQRQHPELKLWLVSEVSLSWILDGSLHQLRGLKSSNVFTQNLGIVPIYGPTQITTKGLEWDVTDWDTRMGGNVSSSNHVQEDMVEISALGPVLVTIERQKGLPSV